METQYHSRHVAKVIRTGQLLFSGPDNDLKNEALSWYSHDNGNDLECKFIMDNKQFLRMLKERGNRVCKNRYAEEPIINVLR